MARQTDDKKRAILTAIHEHLMLEGPKNWDKVQERFPEISRPTLFRYIKEVREQVEDAAGVISKEQLIFAQKRIRSKVEAPEKVQEKIKAHLPVAPSPAVVAADQKNALAAFDFFAFFGQIVKDAELARDSTVTIGPDGEQKIRNPVMMDRSIARRLSIIETYLHSIETVYNAERLRDLYELIIEEVGKADPDIQQAVLARLRALNNKRGLTMAARP